MQSDKSNTYPKAGEKAPSLVKLAVDYFRRMPAAQRAKKPLLYWLLGSSTPDYKMSKKDSLYSNKSNGTQKCSNCIFAYTSVKNKNNICSQIAGDIKLGGWCRLWHS